MQLGGLYAIVDVRPGDEIDPAAWANAVLGDRREGGRDGACVVQLRAKTATTAERIAWAKAMLAVCRAADVPLLVNDDLEAALAAGADGVHLGQDDPLADDTPSIRARARAAGRDDFRIGLSTHDLGQLRDAGRRAPDYLAYGPVRSTSSKRDPDPVVGMDGLVDACRVAARPLVAIGGLDATHGAEAMRVGAAAVAVISALRRPTLEEIRQQAIALSRTVQQAGRPLSLDEVAARIPVLDREWLAELARWGDSLGTQLQLKLPARFRPWIDAAGQPRYRPCDVLDLEHALGKRPRETWAQWHDRDPVEAGPIVQLRRN